MSMVFVHQMHEQRVIFDAGGAVERIAGEATRLGAGAVGLIASERDRELGEALTAELPIALRWTEVRPHVPVDVASRATNAIRASGVDTLVCVGGGSTIGLAKIVALTAGLPIIAVPTTLSGSEGTPVWGLTENGAKQIGVDEKVLPTTVVYDSDLLRSLPAGLFAASGLNALAHAVDALWAPNANPINRLFALEAVEALSEALPKIVAGGDRTALDQALYGCYLGAVAFASAGAGLHHKICHVLGGTFGLPHAQTHATVLPHVVALNAAAVPVVAAQLADALGKGNSLPGEHEAPEKRALAALLKLNVSLGLSSPLADLGLTADDLPDAARRIVAAAPDSNPVTVTHANITALLRDALSGSAPAGTEQR